MKIFLLTPHLGSACQFERRRVVRMTIPSIKVLMLGVLLLTAGVAGAAAPLGTGFTYQGRLEDGSLPANGLFDFNFRLYDAETGGTSVGLPAIVSTNLVATSNGVFSVYLDFGSVFNGDRRWLEISVNTNLARPLSALIPRQPLHATPYALHALKAGTANTATTAGGVPWAGITGLPPGLADGIDNDTTYTAGQGLSLSGTTFSVNPAFGDGRYWTLFGNGGTTPGPNFLGTTDNQPLELKANNARALRLEPSATSPNLIGGHVANTVTAGSFGASIGGGGGVNQGHLIVGIYGTIAGGVANTNTAAYASIGGGIGNRATGQDAVVAGGSGNAAAAGQSTVAGGIQNRANASQSTVGGGALNNASGTNATVSGGQGNTNTATASVIAGGQQNFIGASVFDGLEFDTTNRAFQAAILGGQGNLVSSAYGGVGSGFGNRVYGDYGVIGGGIENQVGDPSVQSSGAIIGSVGGGSNNRANASGTTVAGGERNVADGLWSSIPGGVQARTRSRGQVSFAAGQLDAVGDAQASSFVLRRRLSGGGDLFLDGNGASDVIRVPNGAVWTLRFQISAVSVAGANFASYEVSGMIANLGGVTTFRLLNAPANTAPPIFETAGATAWLATPYVAGNDGVLRVAVSAGEAVKWCARIDVCEVTR